MRLFSIALLLCVGIAVSAQAQSADVYTSNLAQSESADPAIAVKWVTNMIVNRGAVNVYRLDKSGASRKLTSEPIRRITSSTSADTDLQMLIAFAKDTVLADPDDKEMRDFLLAARAEYDPLFARILGIYFVDSTAKRGETYRYEVREISSNGKETLLGTSSPILAGTFTPGAPPKDFKGTAGDHVIRFTWERTAYDMYNIYRSSSPQGAGALLNPIPVIVMEFTTDGKSSAPANFFRDTTAENGVTYYYTLRGIDVMGNESRPSAALALMAHDETPPLPVQNLDVSHDSDVRVSWTPSVSPDAKTNIIYRSTTLKGKYEKWGEVPARTGEFVDMSARQGANYYYVETVDQSGNASKTYAIKALLRDITPPSTPTNLKAVGGVGVVTLNWNRSSEPDVKGYIVYRSIKDKPEEYLLLTPHAVPATTYVDSLPQESHSAYFYKIAALDKTYNQSDLTPPVSVVQKDAIAPTTPAITDVYASDRGMVIAWQPSPESDVAGYRLLRAVQPADSLSAPQFAPVTSELLHSTQYTDASANGVMLYAVQSVDSSGNTSSSSRSVVARVIRQVELQQVSGLQFSFDTVQHGLRLQWLKTPNTLYQVYRREDGIEVPMPVSGQLDTAEFFDAATSPEKHYYYRIDVSDPEGNYLHGNEIEAVF